jgi:hypothetical protein
MKVWTLFLSLLWLDQYLVTSQSKCSVCTEYIREAKDPLKWGAYSAAYSMNEPSLCSFVLTQIIEQISLFVL